MIVSVTMVKNLFTGFLFLKLELFQPLLNDYRFPSCKGALKGMTRNEADYWQGDPRSSCSPAASARAASSRDQFQRRHPGLPAIGRLCNICKASAQRCERFSFGSASISSGTASGVNEAAYAASEWRQIGRAHV